MSCCTMNWFVKAVLSAVVFLAVSVSHGLDHGALRDAVAAADSPKEIQRVLKRFDVINNADSELAQLASQIAYKPLPSADDLSALRSAVEVRALASGAVPDPKNLDRLSDLKNSPLYHDPGVQHESNWLQKSMESLGEWIRNLFNFDRPRSTGGSGPALVIPEFITWGVWAVVVVAALAALFYIVKAVATNQKRAKRTKALISEEEASLTADEWIKRADALIASGEYREAVRCLYVACLLRMDQTSVLEFRMHETNWEHLGRYHDAARKPDFNFTTPTREFDLIWYGHRGNGLEDAVRFKEYYEALLRALKAERSVA